MLTGLMQITTAEPLMKFSRRIAFVAILISASFAVLGVNDASFRAVTPYSISATPATGMFDRLLGNDNATYQTAEYCGPGASCSRSCLIVRSFALPLPCVNVLHNTRVRNVTTFV